MKNILAENMRRFGTKNLSEQIPDTREYVYIGDARIKTDDHSTNDKLRFNLRDVKLPKGSVFTEPTRGVYRLFKPDASIDRIKRLQIEIRRPIEIDNGSADKLYRVNDRNTIKLIGFDPADWNDPTGVELKEFLYNLFKDFVAPPAVPTPQNLKP